MINQDEVHGHCSLSRKTVSELTSMCDEAVERKDWSVAYHCAVHHALICHNGLNVEQAKFFMDTDASGPTNVAVTMCNEMAHACITTVSEKMSHQDHGFHAEMMGKLLIKSVAGEVRDAMVPPAVGMTSFTIYVFTRGKGCLFSLIDEDLCKEAIQ